MPADVGWTVELIAVTKVKEIECVCGGTSYGLKWRAWKTPPPKDSRSTASSCEDSALKELTELLISLC